MTEKLKKLAEEILRLDGEASAGQWLVEPEIGVRHDYPTLKKYDEEYNQYPSITRQNCEKSDWSIPLFFDYEEAGIPRKDAELIAYYRNHAPTLAKALLKAMEALSWYGDCENYAGKCDDYQDPNCPIWSETDNDRGERARTALREMGELG